MKKLLSKITVLLVAVLTVAMSISFGGCKELNWEEKSFNATKTNGVINLEVSVGTANLSFYEGDYISISYPSSDKYTYVISETEDMLIVRPSGAHFITFSTKNMPALDIKLPSSVKASMILTLNAGILNVSDGEFNNLNLTLNAGVLDGGAIICEQYTASVSAGLMNVNSVVCKKADLSMAAGAMTYKNLVADDMKINVEAGILKSYTNCAIEEYGISIDGSLSACNVSAQQGTTEKTVNIKISAGTVQMYFLGQEYDI